MSAQLKKTEHMTEDQYNDAQDLNIKTKRPNIDHLIKRINGERKKERRSNLRMMIVGVLAIAVFSFVFTQA